MTKWRRIPGHTGRSLVTFMTSMTMRKDHPTEAELEVIMIPALEAVTLDQCDHLLDHQDHRIHPMGDMQILRRSHYPRSYLSRQSLIGATTLSSNHGHSGPLGSRNT